MRLYGTVPSPREGNWSSETLNFFTRFLYLSYNRLRIGSFSRILQRSLIRHLQVIIIQLSFNSIHSSLKLKSHWLSWAFRGSCFRPKSVLEKPHLMYEPRRRILKIHTWLFSWWAIPTTQVTIDCTLIKWLNTVQHVLTSNPHDDSGGLISEMTLVILLVFPN